jgi:hypothetical protein
MIILQLIRWNVPSAIEIMSLKAQAETAFKDFSEGVETHVVVEHILKPVLT